MIIAEKYGKFSSWWLIKLFNNTFIVVRPSDIMG
jgi:hypothetical protein